MKTIKIPWTKYRLQLVSERELKEQAESRQISNKVLTRALHDNMQLIEIVRRYGYEWPPKSSQ